MYNFINNNAQHYSYISTENTNCLIKSLEITYYIINNNKNNNYNDDIHESSIIENLIIDKYSSFTFNSNTYYGIENGNAHKLSKVNN